MTRQQTPSALRWRVAFWLALTLSLAVRLVALDAPLLEAHGFRQTQTAISVWAMLQTGPDPLRYETPVLGPPWSLPFEFPTYQLTAWLGVRATGLPLDVACRLISLLYFYLSAWMLFCLCRGHFPRGHTADWILLVYLWTPFNLFWSRACLIDFSAVFFALSYMVSLERWLKTRRPGWAAACLAAGILGYLTKITTMAIVVVPLGWTILRFLLPWWPRAAEPERRKPLWLWAVVLALVLLPVAVGYGWVVHTDQVKLESGGAAFLHSQRLSTWNLGTIAQRAELGAWQAICARILDRQLPAFGLLLALGGLITAWHRSREHLEFLLLTGAGLLTPIVVFFNLYRVHDYYLIAVAPFAAIGLGYGLSRFVSHRSWLFRTGVVLGLAASFAWALPSCIAAIERSYHSKYLRSAAVIREVTPENEHVLITDRSWQSTYLYYARRRGLMLLPGQPIPAGMLRTEPFRTVVTTDPPEPSLEAVWSVWRPVARLEDLTVYRVSP